MSEIIPNLLVPNTTTMNLRFLSLLACLFFYSATTVHAQCDEYDMQMMCEDDAAITAQVSICANACAFGADAENCFNACMVDALPEMSLNCIDCYTGQVSCATDNCLIACAFGTAEDCAACVLASCGAAFMSCAGIEDVDLDGESNVCDCDDANPAVYPPNAPGTAEGLDNNCDGEISAEEELTAGCDGDINGDGTVTVADILILLGNFGCVSGCTADLNADGMVTVTDVLILLGAFGTSC